MPPYQSSIPVSGPAPGDVVAADRAPPAPPIAPPPAPSIPPPPAPPITPSIARIEALDVLRGVAICGILLMNIWKMGGVATLPVSRFPARLDAEWISWGLQSLLIDGAMRGLFTLMFGASMLLMLRRVDEGRVAPLDAWARRSLGLMALGLFQWLVLQWPGEILWNYGIAGLFLLAFRTARPRALMAFAGAIILLLSLNSAYRCWQDVDQLHAAPAATAALAAGRPIDAEARAAIAAAEVQRRAVRPTDAERAGAIRQRTHLPGLLKWGEHFWTGENIGLSGWIEVAESVSFMMIGMALLRMGILTGEASAATYRRMVAVGYGGGLALRSLLVVAAVRSGWDMTLPVVSTAWWTVALAVFQPARLLVTLGHVGLILLLFRHGAFGRATTLRAMGRMTLSIYCLQSAVTSVLFYGLALLGRFDLPELWGMAVLIWLGSAGLCRWWLARHAMGPAESALRRFAHGAPAETLPLSTDAVAAR